MGWKPEELARIERNRAENRKRNVAAPPTEGDRRNRERNRRPNQASPGGRPDRGRLCEQRKYVVVSKKCAHGRAGDVVELEATASVEALVEAGALRLYVKAAVTAEAREASDG